MITSSFKVNVDRVQGTRVTSLPTIMFYKGGAKISEVVGANVPQIDGLISRHATPVPSQSQGVTPHGVVSSPKADPELVAQLVDMGFSKSKATKAVLSTGGEGIDAATEWIMLHEGEGEDDDDVSAQPQPQPSSLSSEQSNVLASALASALAAAAAGGGSLPPASSPSSANQQDLSPEDIEKQRILLQEKLKKKREEREKEDVIQMGERKRQEIDAAKKLHEQREKWKEEQRIAAIKKAEDDRKEAERAKKELKRQLEYDRKERLDNLKPHGTVVDQGVSPAPAPAVSLLPPSSSQADFCDLQIRLPNGSKLQHRFLPSDTLDDVYTYVLTNRPDGSSEPFVLMTSFPKRVFVGEDAMLTLLEVGLVPRGVLLVQRK
jgi:hypothetical protein